MDNMGTPMSQTDRFKVAAREEPVRRIGRQNVRLLVWNKVCWRYGGNWKMGESPQDEERNRARLTASCLRAVKLV